VKQRRDQKHHLCKNSGGERKQQRIEQWRKERELIVKQNRGAHNGGPKESAVGSVKRNVRDKSSRKENTGSHSS